MSNDLAERRRARSACTAKRLPIEAPFEGFLDALAPAVRRAAADITEENLQARCRGVMLMALANKFGGMVLTTGNKSEIAVGYATIYGDMCGGYAPLKDVYKTEVFALCRWRNAQWRRRIIPEAVIARAALGRTAREPDGPGFAAALRNARRASCCATSSRSSRRRDRRRGLRRSDGASACCAGARSANGSGSRRRPGRRCRAARSGASAAIRSPRAGGLTLERAGLR